MGEMYCQHHCACAVFLGWFFTLFIPLRMNAILAKKIFPITRMNSSRCEIQILRDLINIYFWVHELIKSRANLKVVEYEYILPIKIIGVIKIVQSMKNLSLFSVCHFFYFLWYFLLSALNWWCAALFWPASAAVAWSVVLIQLKVYP